MKKPITNKVLWIFAVGQFGWSLLAGLISNWLVFYYTGEGILSGHITQGKVFLGLTIIGLITAFGRVFDAVTDPLIAGMSDRSKNPKGRRIPFMRIAAIPFALITALIFILPSFSSVVVNDIILFVALVLFYLFMTTYCTPYNALLPELGNTQKNRVNVSTFISLTYIVGLSVSYLVPNVAGLFSFAGEAGSIRAAIGVMSLVAAVCMLIPSLLIKESDYIDVKPSETDSLQSLFKTFKNGQFRRFVYSDVIYFFAVTLFQTGLAFYVTKLMKVDDKNTFMLSVIMTVSSLILYLPVNKLAQRMGKKALVIFGFFFYTGVFVLTAMCGEGIIWGYIIAALAGIPMAILGILPQAIVADISEADAIQTGEKREGMFFAARTFAFKMGQAISLLVFTSVTTSATESSYRLTAVIAAVCCAIGAVLLTLYKEKDVMAVIEKHAKGEEK
ncbi:MAG: MFS transporter [Ruminococcus sp.]|nr:MFS transporter [Ruminococcus sp.]